jgi:hypothetical protein
MRVANGIHLGQSLFLPVGAVNPVQTLKVCGFELVFQAGLEGAAKAKESKAPNTELLVGLLVEAIGTTVGRTDCRE